MTIFGVRMIVLLTILLPAFSHAQTLRTDFRVSTKGGAKINAIAKDSIGNYLIAGRFDEFEYPANSSNPAVHSLAKIDTNGNLINSFHRPLIEGTVSFMKVQSDGKIIIAGGFKRVDGKERNRIARLEKDGRLDLGFNLNHNFYYINSIDLQSNDDLLVAGPLYDWSAGKWTLVRYKKNSNDTDANFIFDSRFVQISKVKADKNNRIIAMGFISNQMRVYRILENGQIDPAFKFCNSNTNDGSSPLELSEILVQKSNSFFLLGNFTSFNGVLSKNIAKIDSLGNVDSDFGASVGPNLGSLTSGALLQEDQIAVTDWNELSIINPNGTRQPIMSGYSNSLVFADDQINKIILCGGFSWVNNLSQSLTSYKKQIVRINRDFTTDETFNPLFNSFNQLKTIAVQDDNKLLAGGYSSQLFDVISGKSASFFRLNKNGLVDNALSVYPLFNGVLTIFPKSDGKTLIGGELLTYDNTSVNGIVQLNADGSIDNSFRANQNLDQVKVNKIVQTDSAIFLGGAYQYSVNYSSQRLIKLNLDGSAATDFSCQLPAWEGCVVDNFKILDNKKILVSGIFQFDGNLYFMCRLNEDGSLDNTFNKIPWTINDFEIDSKGRIIISSDAFYYKGAQRQGIVRLYPDGTIDGSFSANELYTGDVPTRVTGVDLLPDNKVIVTGNFSQFKGQSARSILLLDTVGNVISTPRLQFLQHTFVNSSLFKDGMLYLVGGIYAPNYQSSVAMIDFKLPNLDINLQAITQTDSVGLNWVTNTNDINVKGFRIERSQQNQDFIAIDSVDSSVPQYVDTKVKKDNSYTYRISAIYDWGSSNYSNAAVAKLPGNSIPPVTITSIEKKENGITVYPNPVSTMVNIVAPNGESIQKINLFTSSGFRIPIEANSELGSTKPDLSSYPPGLYILSITTEKRSAVIKLIKH